MTFCQTGDNSLLPEVDPTSVTEVSMEAEDREGTEERGPGVQLPPLPSPPSGDEVTCASTK